MAAEKKATKKTSKRAAKAAGFVLQISEREVREMARKAYPGGDYDTQFDRRAWARGFMACLRASKRAAASALAQRER